MTGKLKVFLCHASEAKPIVGKLHRDVTVTSQGVTPKDIFHYAYAVFHSPTYRRRYAEFLKIDFTRLPLTSGKSLFFALAVKGKMAFAQTSEVSQTSEVWKVQE